jgi:hypothetical protein
MNDLARNQFPENTAAIALTPKLPPIAAVSPPATIPIPLFKLGFGVGSWRGDQGWVGTARGQSGEERQRRARRLTVAGDRGNRESSRNSSSANE